MSKRSAAAVLWVPEFISPRELSIRWRCGRSSVDRVAKRNGFTRTYLGVGDNGMVRYLRKEVEAYEASRRVRMS